MKSSIQNQYLKVQVQHRGAQLCSISTIDHEYIWQGDPAFWGKHSPVLFPIVGTLKKNEYFVNGKSYPMSRHGFARDFDFELVHESPQKLTFELKSNAETKQQYPFEFSLQITYELSNLNLKVSFVVKNCDQTSMPFSIGAHPAFAIGCPLENCQLKFDKQETLKSYLLQNNLLSENTIDINLESTILNLDYKLFENDALVFKKLESTEIILIENGTESLMMSFQDFPNLGLWTVKNAPFICIEPWLGYTDLIDSDQNLFSKEGITILPENQQFECSYAISIL